MSGDAVALALLPESLAADSEESGGRALVTAARRERGDDGSALGLGERRRPGPPRLCGRGRIEHGPFGAEHRALEDVAQLTQVARPGIAEHPGRGARVELEP